MRPERAEQINEITWMTWGLDVEERDRVDVEIDGEMVGMRVTWVEEGGERALVRCRSSSDARPRSRSVSGGVWEWFKRVRG